MAGERRQYPDTNVYSSAMYARISDENQRFPNAAFASFAVARIFFADLTKGRGTLSLFSTISPSFEQRQAMEKVLTYHHRQAGVDVVRTKPRDIRLPDEEQLAEGIMEQRVFETVKRSALNILIEAAALTPPGTQILAEIQQANGSSRRRSTEYDREQMLTRFAQEGGQWRDVVLSALQTTEYTLNTMPKSITERYHAALLEEWGYRPVTVGADTFSTVKDHMYTRMTSSVYKSLEQQQLTQVPGFDAKRFANVFRLERVIFS